MPRTQTLLLTATRAAVCCGARAQSRPQQTPPPARDSEQDAEKLRLAAKGMIFTPSVHEGRRVSQFIVLEYNFNIH